MTEELSERRRKIEIHGELFLRDGERERETLELERTENLMQLIVFFYLHKSGTTVVLRSAAISSLVPSISPTLSLYSSFSLQSSTISLSQMTAVLPHM